MYYIYARTSYGEKSYFVSGPYKTKKAAQVEIDNKNMNLVYFVAKRIEDEPEQEL